MREVTTQVFKFDELTESAKEFARNEFRQWPDLWSWESEWYNSAKMFGYIAPIEIGSADYDRAQVRYRMTCDPDTANLSGLRAWKWLENHGLFDLAKRNSDGARTLTGYCGDCPLFDPIAKFARNPLQVPDLESLFYDCLQSWIFEARRDMEYASSEESIDNMIEANSWEFTAEGEMV